MQKNMTWDNVGLTYVSFTSRLIKRGAKKNGMALKQFFQLPSQDSNLYAKGWTISYPTKQLK